MLISNFLHSNYDFARLQLHDNILFCLVLLFIPFVLILVFTLFAEGVEGKGKGKMDIEFLINKSPVQQNPLPNVNLVFIQIFGNTRQNPTRFFFFDTLSPGGDSFLRFQACNEGVRTNHVVNGINYTGIVMQRPKVIDNNLDIRKFGLNPRTWPNYCVSHNVTTNLQPLYVDTSFYAHVHRKA